MIHKPEVRCHQCGELKKDEGTGIYLAFKAKEVREGFEKKEYMIWFDNEACKALWLDKYGVAVGS